MPLKVKKSETAAGDHNRTETFRFRHACNTRVDFAVSRDMLSDRIAELSLRMGEPTDA